MDIDMPEYDAEAVSVMRGGVGKGGREGREGGREGGREDAVDRAKSLALCQLKAPSPAFTLRLLCFALLCFTLLCFALLCFALLCFALLCFTLPYSALLCSNRLCICASRRDYICAYLLYITARSGKRKGEREEGKTGRGG